MAVLLGVEKSVYHRCRPLRGDPREGDGRSHDRKKGWQYSPGAALIKVARDDEKDVHADKAPAERIDALNHQFRVE